MKKETLIKIPGYIYNEYKLILRPNEDVLQKIENLKSDFREKYKLEASFSSRPALTLARFIQFEMTEIRLVQRLHNLAKGFRPFNVELNGFGSLPTHTLYINIESKRTIQTLIKELTSERQLMTLNAQNKPHFMNDPHFILAGKLSPGQYKKSMLYYSHQQFKSRFIAEEMILLKRTVTNPDDAKSDRSGYQTAGIFTFQNVPEKISQGDLFG